MNSGALEREAVPVAPSGTRRVNLVTNPVISRELGKDREVQATSGTYPCIRNRKGVLLPDCYIYDLK